MTLVFLLSLLAAAPSAELARAQSAEGPSDMPYLQIVPERSEVTVAPGGPVRVAFTFTSNATTEQVLDLRAIPLTFSPEQRNMTRPFQLSVEPIRLTLAAGEVQRATVFVNVWANATEGEHGIALVATDNATSPPGRETARFFLYIMGENEDDRVSSPTEPAVEAEPIRASTPPAETPGPAAFVAIVAMVIGAFARRR